MVARELDARVVVDGEVAQRVRARAAGTGKCRERGDDEQGRDEHAPPHPSASRATGAHRTENSGLSASALPYHDAHRMRGHRRSRPRSRGGRRAAHPSSPAGARAPASVPPRRSGPRARAPTRGRRRPGSKAGRPAHGGRARPSPPAGSRGRPGRPPTRGRPGGRSRRAACRSPRPSPAGARRAALPAPLEQVAEQRDELGQRNGVAARRAAPTAAPSRPRAASMRACCSSAKTYPGKIARAARTCSAAARRARAELELCELDVRPRGRLGRTRSRVERQSHRGDRPCAVAGQLAGVRDAGVPGERRLDGDHPLERRERVA